MARIPYYPTTDNQLVTHTTAPLGANASFSTDTISSQGLSKIVGSVFADQAGTIFIEQSPDGTNWDVSTSYTVDAEDGKGIDEDVLLNFVRVRYTNGGTLQTEFRLYVGIV